MESIGRPRAGCPRPHPPVDLLRPGLVLLDLPPVAGDDALPLLSLLVEPVLLLLQLSLDTGGEKSSCDAVDNENLPKVNPFFTVD